MVDFAKLHVDAVAKREALRKTTLLAKYGTHKNGHSLFAPSASAGWLNCSGFLLANAKAADDAGVDAAYGTVAHHVAERWQRLGYKPVKLLGRTEEAHAGGNSYAITIDQAMMEFVEEYVDWCNEVPGDHFHEQKVNFGDLMPIPDQGGTADHFAIDRTTLVITDLKMGTGVRVYAEGNTQAQLYALGVFREYDWIYGFQKVIIRICQPRLDVFETWERSRAEMLEFEAYVRDRAEAAWHEDAPRTPSEKACRWCKVQNTCPAKLAQVDDLLDAIFDADEDEQGLGLAAADGRSHTPSVAAKLLPLHGMEKAITNPEGWKKLSTAGMSYALTFRKSIETMFNKMFQELLDRAERGEKLPFQSLKDGRQTRDWIDREEAGECLVHMVGLTPEVVFPPSMISVAEAEKAIRAQHKDMKPKEIAKLLEEKVGIKKMAGKRTLAPLTDDRPDVNDLIDSAFEPQEGDETDL